MIPAQNCHPHSIRFFDAFQRGKRKKRPRSHVLCKSEFGYVEKRYIRSRTCCPFSGCAGFQCADGCRRISDGGRSAAVRRDRRGGCTSFPRNIKGKACNSLLKIGNPSRTHPFTQAVWRNRSSSKFNRPRRHARRGRGDDSQGKSHLPGGSLVSLQKFVCKVSHSSSKATGLTVLCR